jgi:hypothetical protein
MTGSPIDEIMSSMSSEAGRLGATFELPLPVELATEGTTEVLFEAFESDARAISWPAAAAFDAMPEPFGSPTPTTV